MNKLNFEDHSFENLVVRFLRKQATEEEITLLRSWLKESDQNQRKFDELCDVWMASAQVYRKNDYQPQMGWLRYGLKKPSIPFTPQLTDNNKHLFIRWQWIAAIFLIAFITGSLSMYFFSTVSTDQKRPFFTEQYVPYGSKSEVTLPDGTRVWINSGSRLRYSQKFNAIDRQVSLEGEAYFDVAKNAKKPFLVNTSGITVKVIGTAFNVKAYPDEKTIETTVERGLVQVISNLAGRNNGEKVFLHPKQKATFLKDRVSFEKDRASTVATTDNLKQKQEQVKTNPLIVHNDVVTKFSTSWKDTRWVIEREELQDLVVKIERRYNVNIEFADSKIKKFVFSGVLDDESLEQVLEVIKLSAPIKYSLNQKKITLYENKSFINRDITH